MYPLESGRIQARIFEYIVAFCREYRKNGSWRNGKIRVLTLSRAASRILPWSMNADRVCAQSGVFLGVRRGVRAAAGVLGALMFKVPLFAASSALFPLQRESNRHSPAAANAVAGCSARLPASPWLLRTCYYGKPAASNTLQTCCCQHPLDGDFEGE